MPSHRGSRLAGRNNGDPVGPKDDVGRWGATLKPARRRAGRLPTPHPTSPERPRGPPPGDDQPTASATVPRNVLGANGTLDPHGMALSSRPGVCPRARHAYAYAAALDKVVEPKEQRGTVGGDPGARKTPSRPPPYPAPHPAQAYPTRELRALTHAGHNRPARIEAFPLRSPAAVLLSTQWRGQCSNTG